MASLQSQLRELKRVAVAFSGGVDSAFLLRVAHDVLGEDALAVTATAPFFPEREQQEATAFCQEYGIRQIHIPSNELQKEEFRSNPPNRCYLCKRSLFAGLLECAHANGISFVLDGTNMDDEGDYRPGMKALRELGILSPLRQAGFHKFEIREWSRRLGLPTAEKPSCACLASRFVYGETITKEKLRMVDKAELFLHDLGFLQLRVRVHGDLARIELLPEDLPRFWEGDTPAHVRNTLKQLGFAYVALDLQGYRTGSMNEVLPRS
ncbi:MAG: ATP-dependent sacrificial sulfur transferase LarE [Victivallales bacterium]|nr:ATP-dependent sacrificial sulfur transferase LarE [Victivallales bacterium]